jgi:hypothetical protein
VRDKWIKILDEKMMMCEKFVITKKHLTWKWRINGFSYILMDNKHQLNEKCPNLH